MVLAGYDLLEDRRRIDVIITKYFPPCFKMAESFGNLFYVTEQKIMDENVVPRH